MKAKTNCPKCKKEVIENCYGCIRGDTLVCPYCPMNDGVPQIYDEVNWEIIEE